MKRSIVTRRDTLKCLGSAAVTASTAGMAAAAQDRRRPNIVFILADDLGYADLSCYGQPDFRTPNIDRLAERGIRFRQGYANSAVCSATRTALITGRYQYRLPVGLEEPLASHSPDVGLPPEIPTLPSILRRASYATALVGKWHLGRLPKYGPLKSGYDHFFGFRGGAVDYFTHKGSGAKDDLWDDDRPVHDPRYLTRLLGERAERVIDTQAKAGLPFFLSLHFNAPHWPWEGPGDDAESARIGDRLRDFDGGSSKTYGAMVVAMDEEVGKVLAALDRNGLTENTIVVFTSDNGGERFSDTWPFSGQKTELLEGGLRVPAIVAWPGVTRHGAISEQPMITMDWLPTLLAAAGAVPDPAYPSDGIDLARFLQGGAPVSRTFFWRYKGNHQRAVREGDFKYLKILDNTFLFDVVEDPRERANLKDRYRGIYDRLVAGWHAWNNTMLPEIDASFTEDVSGDHQADHIGTPATKMDADTGADD